MAEQLYTVASIKRMRDQFLSEKVALDGLAVDFLDEFVQWIDKQNKAKQQLQRGRAKRW